MKDGDFAGLCLLQKNYGLVGVKVDGTNKTIVMINATGGKPVEAAQIPLNQKTVYFKAECDFTDKKDVADFFYSLDGKLWKPIGTQLKMAYTLPHFMGYRFGLFNYATKNAGGYADFDFFRITDSIPEGKLIKSIYKQKIMKLTLFFFLFVESVFVCQSYTISSPDKIFLLPAWKSCLLYILKTINNTRLKLVL
jgi:hypothetical protein